jgi:hypothetical protein
MDIVFSKWASNIACKKLRQALGTLHILKVLQKRLQTAYSTAVSAEFEQKRRIQELESEILAERATLAERKRQHTKAGQAMEARVKTACQRVLASLSASCAAKDEQIINPKFRTDGTAFGFLKNLTETHGSSLEQQRGFFDEQGKLSSSRSNGTEDWRVYLPDQVRRVIL